MLNSDHMFLHLITICIGLIIAFGLQQIVDLFLRRRRARKQQAAEAQASKPPDDTPTPPSSTHHPALTAAIRSLQSSGPVRHSQTRRCLRNA